AGIGGLPHLAIRGFDHARIIVSDVRRNRSRGSVDVASALRVVQVDALAMTHRRATHGPGLQIEELYRAAMAGRGSVVANHGHRFSSRHEREGLKPDAWQGSTSSGGSTGRQSASGPGS